MKAALGEIASPYPRVAPVTAAWWTVAAWLLQLLQALITTQTTGKPPNGRALGCICRIVRRFRLHQWADLGDLGDTEAFRHWFGAVKHHLLMNKQYVVWLRLDAQLRAKAVSRRDIDARRRSWQSWLQEGPAQGLGRQHRMSRVVGGWIPAPVGCAALAGEADDELTSDTLHGSEVNVDEWSVMPLHSQQEVEQEARAWAEVWQASERPPAPLWPADLGMAMPAI